MSQQKNTTSGTTLITLVLNKSFEFLKWFIGSFLIKAATLLWDKSFSLSGFVLEMIEAQKGSIPSLKRRALKNLFSTLIFIFLFILLAVIMKLIFGK